MRQTILLQFALTCVGFLLVLGLSLHRWRRLYFVLCHDSLAVYLNSNMINCVQQYDTRKISNVNWHQNESAGIHFDVITTPLPSFNGQLNSCPPLFQLTVNANEVLQLKANRAVDAMKWTSMICHVVEESSEVNPNPEGTSRRSRCRSRSRATAVFSLDSPGRQSPSESFDDMTRSSYSPTRRSLSVPRMIVSMDRSRSNSPTLLHSTIMDMVSRFESFRNHYGGPITEGEDIEFDVNTMTILKSTRNGNDLLVLLLRKFTENGISHQSSVSINDQWMLLLSQLLCSDYETLLSDTIMQSPKDDVTCARSVALLWVLYRHSACRKNHICKQSQKRTCDRCQAHCKRLYQFIKAHTISQAVLTEVLRILVRSCWSDGEFHCSVGERVVNPYAWNVLFSSLARCDDEPTRVVILKEVICLLVESPSNCCHLIRQEGWREVLVQLGHCSGSSSMLSLHILAMLHCRLLLNDDNFKAEFEKTNQIMSSESLFREKTLFLTGFASLMTGSLSFLPLDYSATPWQR